MIFGAHCSTAGGVQTALSRAEKIGADCVQIFVKNNMQWFGRAPAPEEAARFARERKRLGLGVVFGHAGYLINLGAPPSANRAKSVQSLIQEITFAGALGLPFLVLHPGAHLGTGEERGLKQIIAGLDEVCRRTGTSPVRIALENTAGQGSCLGNRLEHLAAIYERVKKPERLALCIDTAHLFAAGHDIRAANEWDKTIKRLDALIGRKQIVAFHLNDSKTGLGSARGQARAHRPGENRPQGFPAHCQRRAIQKNSRLSGDPEIRGPARRHRKPGHAEVIGWEVTLYPAQQAAV